MTLTLAAQLAIAGVSVGSIYALVALAIVIPFKASGVLNFGQGEIVTVGAYAALILTQLGLPYAVVIAGVLLLGAVGGMLIERTLIRPIVNAPEFTLVIATFAIGLLIKGLISLRFGDSAASIDGPFGTDPIMAVGLRFNPTSLWILGCTTGTKPPSGSVKVTVTLPMPGQVVALGKLVLQVKTDSSSQMGFAPIGITGVVVKGPGLVPAAVDSRSRRQPEARLSISRSLGTSTSAMPSQQQRLHSHSDFL